MLEAARVAQRLAEAPLGRVRRATLEAVRPEAARQRRLGRWLFQLFPYASSEARARRASSCYRHTSLQLHLANGFPRSSAALAASSRLSFHASTAAFTAAGAAAAAFSLFAAAAAAAAAAFSLFAAAAAAAA